MADNPMPKEAKKINDKLGKYGTANNMPTIAVNKIR